MSTGLNCEFIEVPGRGHYYILERGSSPKMAWDWREYADAYGPFPTEEAADKHLGNCHANPGGADMVGVVDPAKEPYLTLLADARRPTGSRSWTTRDGKVRTSGPITFFD